MGQWSGRNRAQAQTSQCIHKRPHISDSAEQEAGGGGGGGKSRSEESEEEVQGGEDEVGWCLAFWTCIRGKKEGERGGKSGRVLFSP